MTEQELAAIRARCDATPHGPWHWETSLAEGQGGYPQRVSNPEALVIADCFESPDRPAVIADFITHARTDVPALLDEIKGLNIMTRAFESTMNLQNAEIERLRKNRKELLALIEELEGTTP